MARQLKMIFFVLCLLATSVNAFSSQEAEFKGKNWAVIVAGSYGYGNYRHQADACHAYQILHRNGIPDEQIVVMMYDDIAYNEENPTQGVIINHLDGPNVYKGVPKDYNNKDVTPENFLNVLQGKKSAMSGIGSGKVIESGPKDHVFVYFTDHGAPGLVAFPEEELHAVDLIAALNSMYEDKKYAKLVFYLEACESGSMFKNLSSNINIFATSASNADESSYACYFDDKRDTYLGDVYSVKWMEDSDSETLSKESLHKQFKIVKAETNTSHVQEFGDMKMAKDKVGDYQGDKAKPLPPLPEVPLDAVPSPDVPMAILERKLDAAKTEKEIEEISKKIQDLKQSYIDIQYTIERIIQRATGSDDATERIIETEAGDITNWSCYKQATIMFSRQCYTLGKHDFAMTKMYAFVNLCEERFSTSRVLDAINHVCNIETNEV